MKAIKMSQAKEFATTFFNDPILKMAASAAFENCPGAECTDCKHCSHSQVTSYKQFRWCTVWGSAVDEDGFCYRGE